jgi:predicted MFS family arabinose efflux permease
MSTKKGVTNKWFILILLSAAVGLIYQLPYLRYSYYDAMLEAFGYSNAQLGNLMSAYGIGSVICYIIGGAVADKISSKILLSSGQILTGLAGFWFATFPAYPIAFGISFFWAFTSSLIFWPALINYVRNLGSENEQGRLFGLLEGTRGFISTLIGLGIVAVFNRAVSIAGGLRTVIIIYAIINIVLGIITYFVIPSTENKPQENEGEKVSAVKNFVTALKMPQAWLITVTIFATMMCFICLGYFTPYLTGIMGASVTFAAAIGTLRTWGLQIAGGTSGGFIADKIHSSSLTMVFAFIIIAAGFGVMIFIPGSKNFLLLATILMFTFGLAIYVNRGVYFATLTEAGIPASVNGAVVGFASALGFLPDAFMYTVIGHWLDRYPGAAGYKIIFACALISAGAGLVCALCIYRLSRKQRHTLGSIPQPQEN